MLAAVAPPTCTVHGAARVTPAGSRRRAACARGRRCAAFCGEVVGMTRMTAASPAGSTIGGVTATTSGVSRSAAAQPVERCGVGARGELGGEQERAVEPGAEARRSGGRRPGGVVSDVGLLPASGKPRRIENSGSASTSRIDEAADERGPRPALDDAAPPEPDAPLGGAVVRAVPPAPRSGRSCARRSRAARAAA